MNGGGGGIRGERGGQGGGRGGRGGRGDVVLSKQTQMRSATVA